MIGVGLSLLQAAPRSRRRPAWVLPDAAVDMDFVNDRYFGGSRQGMLVATAGAVRISDGLDSQVGDNLQIVGAALAALRAPAVTVLLETAASSTSSGRLLGWNSFSEYSWLQNGDPETWSYNGTRFLASGDVAGTWADLRRCALAYTAASTKLALGDTAPVADANPPVAEPILSVALGSWAGLANYVGKIRRLVIYKSYLDDAAMRALTADV